jgi:hypothetical protein
MGHHIQASMTPTIDQLNALTDAGVISDLAIQWSDVAPVDQKIALEWLQAQMTGEQQEMGI